MLITNHVLSGAVVGTVAQRPATAFVVGVASHFVLDAIPHWGDIDESEFLRYAVADGLVGLSVMGLAAVGTPRDRRRRVVAGMLGACLPDADKPGELFLGRSPFPAVVDRWHGAIQTESRRRMPQELLVAGVLALLLRRISGRR